ncbi:MAG: hypothetical protein PW735_05975 [Acidobacteriaceae bacterium]|nr:hypothetical protein [Acidobacteriaceae bacterium]
MHMDPAEAQQAAVHAFAVLIPMMVLLWTIGAAILIVPFWQIFKKAGMSPALSLLMVVPLANLVMLYVLAFSQWKIQPALLSPYYAYAYPPAAPAAQAYAPAQATAAAPAAQPLTPAEPAPTPPVYPPED